MFISFILLLLFLGFGAYSDSFQIDTTGTHGQVISGTLRSVPATVTITVDPAYYGQGGLVGGFSTNNTQTWTVTDSGLVGNSFWASNGFNDWQANGAVVTFNIVYENDPGPENPDPENPDPENPDPDDPGSDDPSDLPWAREDTLQSYMSNFQTFSQAFSNWASSLLSDVRSGNTKLDTSITQLMNINNQQINDHSQRNELHDDMKSFLGPVRENVSGIKTGVDDLRIKAGQSLTAQNLGNSYLASIDDHAEQIKNKTASIDNKFSTANSNLSDINDSAAAIKNTLNPQGITSPTAPTPMSSLPSGSGFIQTVKNRLLPGYSFFFSER